MCVGLGSPEGDALLHAPAVALQAFLPATHESVSLGTERKRVDGDASFPDDGPTPENWPQWKRNGA